MLPGFYALLLLGIGLLASAGTVGADRGGRRLGAAEFSGRVGIAGFGNKVSGFPKIVRDFERHALIEADTVPLLWWNRIVATSAKLKGWNITPSHFIGQDLTDVWLDQ